LGTYWLVIIMFHVNTIFTIELCLEFLEFLIWYWISYTNHLNQKNLTVTHIVLHARTHRGIHGHLITAKWLCKFKFIHYWSLCSLHQEATTELMTMEDASTHWSHAPILRSTEQSRRFKKKKIEAFSKMVLVFLISFSYIEW